jgi:hypothetical protein
MRVIFLFIFLIIMHAIVFAAADFTTANAAKVNIETTNGTGNYQDMTQLSNYSDIYSSSSYFHLKAAEAWVYYNDGSEVTGINFNYRIYKEGSTAPGFTSVSLPFGEQNGTGTIYQRYGKYDLDVDLLSGVNSQGTWVFECYYDAATNAVNTNNPIYLSNGGNNYSFTFTADESLPVELTSFTATPTDAGVELNWQTITEVNNYGFQVERKQATGDWLEIGFVEGSGNSNSPKSYSFVDANAPTGELSYRLKQIDTDGSFEYFSTTASVSNGVTSVNENVIPTEYSLNQNFPNPFNPSTQISFALPENGQVDLRVFNSLGQEVALLANRIYAAGNHIVNFDASNLSSGLYYYRLVSNEFVSTKKMLMIK